MYKVLVASLVVLNCYGSAYRNNVCKSFADYATIATNPNCYYNPDVGSPPALIAKRNGYPFQKYKVQTKDGYILSLFRIPNNNTDKTGPRQPLILQHGIAINSAAWLLQGKKSLAFYLVDKGYDVWLTNSRGVQYSTQHVNLTLDHPDYWNFSFHEMGVYDLPAIIDFVAKTTGQAGRIVYIGHSMGTTMSYIYASLMPDHAKQNLRGIVSLAPIAYLRHVRSAAKLIVPFADIIGNALKMFGVNAIGYPKPQQDLIHSICSMLPIKCTILNSALSGLSVEEVSPEIMPLFFSHYPDFTPVKVMLHYGQMLKTGRFSYYDYGTRENVVRYGPIQVPEYPVGNIQVPVHMFAGRNDFLSDLKDVDILMGKLKVETSLHVMSENGTQEYDHNDYLLGKHTDIFYDELYNTLRMHQ